MESGIPIGGCLLKELRSSEFSLFRCRNVYSHGAWSTGSSNTRREAKAPDGCQALELRTQKQWVRPGHTTHQETALGYTGAQSPGRSSTQRGLEEIGWGHGGGLSVLLGSSPAQSFFTIHLSKDIYTSCPRWAWGRYSLPQSTGVGEGADRILTMHFYFILPELSPQPPTIGHSHGHTLPAVQSVLSLPWSLSHFSPYLHIFL